MTEPTTNGNGNLPQDRQAAVEHGLTQYHTMAAERDALAKENSELKTQIAGLKVAFEAQSAQLTTMESRIQSATVVRDQAVADRAVWEILFISIQAQLRAFVVPATPLVKDKTDVVIEDFKDNDSVPHPDDPRRFDHMRVTKSD
jgi:hypothetical protein